MISTLVTHPHPGLRERCGPVSDFGPYLAEAASQMAELMSSSHGAGIAAPQVGWLQRVCLVETRRGLLVLVNPRISAHGPEIELGEEGCLSIPGVFGTVARRRWVEIETQDLEGQRRHLRLEGFEARVAQHEIDHLDGILFIERLDAAERRRIRSSGAAGIRLMTPRSDLHDPTPAAILGSRGAA
ncbi:peptide deformylase [Miltoncostaea oceani]|uniref:peptide deformylase n=1 Tax=Miltoncostaea oceani TaxID=2843216 RepID=UPI002484CFC5|nr:peptide deformylase [Miltoncostaea oceani]